MGRNLTSQQEALLSSSSFIVRTLVDLYLPITIGTRYLTNCERNIFYNGNTYGAVGGLLAIDSVSESLNMSDTQAQLKLSGANPEILQLLENNNISNSPVKTYKVFMDNDFNIIGDPYMDFSGNINNFDVALSEDGSSAVVSLEVSSEFARFDDKKGNRTNDSEQQKRFQNDDFFKYVQSLTEGKEIDF